MKMTTTAGLNHHANIPPITDVYWVQDFTIIRDKNDALLPVKEDDKRFHSTLRCFLETLNRLKAPDQEMALNKRLAPLFAGVNFSGARGTLLASLPGKPGELDAVNGIRGLSAELARYSWPEGARTQPVTYITGAVGKIVEGMQWAQDFRHGVAGDLGAHAPADNPFLDVRVLWPDNATAFQGLPHVRQSLGHNWTYYDENKVRAGRAWLRTMGWDIMGVTTISLYSREKHTLPPLHHTRATHSPSPTACSGSRRPSPAPGPRTPAGSPRSPTSSSSTASCRGTSGRLQRRTRSAPGSSSAPPTSPRRR